jgi:CRISPR/Cas system CSM-associated protein Csm3 (group 7 of RAMP superfamily)
MEFVRTRRDGSSKGQIYIPGPSLKGVIRAQAERICRSLDSETLQRARLERRRVFGDDQRVPLADNPLGDGTSYRGLDDMQYSSGRAIEAMKLDGNGRTAAIYRRSSLVSQIFGHTSLAGRVRFADAYANDLKDHHLEERNGVAIDRIYGSVAVGPFNYETAIGGTFQTRIDFKNLTLAQLGLLGLALRDLAESRVSLGFGKSRGLGRVKVSFNQLSIFYPTCQINDGSLQLLNGRQVASAAELAGLGALCQDEAYRGYDFPASQHDIAPLPDGLAYVADELLGVRLIAAEEAQVRSIWRACMPAWKQEIGL